MRPHSVRMILSSPSSSSFLGQATFRRMKHPAVSPYISPPLTSTRPSSSSRRTISAGGKSQRGTIYPDQVGPLQRHHTKLRQTFCQHIPDNLVIPVKVELQFLQPFLPSVISRFQGIYGKGIDVTHLIDVDGLVNPLPNFFIRRDDIGYLNACQIKRLAGGNTR